MSRFARFAFAVLAAALSSLGLAATAGATTFSNASGIDVPGVSGAMGSPYPSQIAVSGISGQVLSVRASLVSINLETASEMDALLVAPNGQNVVLMSDVCGDLTDVTLTFDDSAVAPLDSPCATGSYQPFDGATTTADFTDVAGPYGTTLGPLGSGPNGTWKLYVLNNGNFDAIGSISGWSLEIVDAITPDLPPPILTPRFCNGAHATIVGTEGTDNIRGTAGDDVIVGLGGHDSIKGLGGRDRICGSGSSDKLYGGDGKDRVFGGTGNDALYGGNGRDDLDGGSGRDRCIDVGAGTPVNNGPTQGLRTTYISCER